MPETGGPPGFSAELAAPDIVLLTWETVPEAVGYKVQIVFSGLDPLTIAYLPADATRFEHFLAPESSLLTYRLQTITASGEAGASSLQIATQGHAANPLAVQAVFSEAGIASAVIGPAGGTIETTDGRGVTYTLVIPPQAIDTDLGITMTPVNTVGDWPLDGNFLGAVRLEPEGWLLNELAYLTIRVPAALDPALTTAGFVFNGSGEEFHLTPAGAGPSPIASLGTGGGHLASPVQQGDAGVFNLPVVELRTTGLGSTSADAAGAMAEEHAPTRSSDAFDQKAAVSDAAEDEMAPLLSNSQLIEIATDNVMNQIYNNVHDCYDFKRAVGAFNAWEAKVAKLGDTSSYDGFRETIMKQLAEKAVKTIENATEDCRQAGEGVVPASIPCAEKLTLDIQSRSNSFYSELSDTIGKDSGLKDRLTAADPNRTDFRCPHSFHVNDAASIGYQWTSGCIPSLDRPYQLVFIGPNQLEGNFRLYPNATISLPGSEPGTDPFSGRAEGDGKIAAEEGTTMTQVYDGTYTIEITKRDNLGNPTEMNATLLLETTNNICVEGAGCQTAVFEEQYDIPLLVNPQRCPTP